MPTLQARPLPAGGEDSCQNTQYFTISLPFHHSFAPLANNFSTRVIVPLRLLSLPGYAVSADGHWLRCNLATNHQKGRERRKNVFGEPYLGSLAEKEPLVL
jgi:hypothetical protein